MLCIVTALQCEARPLIDHYGLRASAAPGGFRVYENDTVALIVGGMGKAAAAAATACLYMHRGAGRNCAWLNCGIAGHGRRAVGAGLVAHKVTDAASGAHWYPPLSHVTPCATDGLITVDRPERDFSRDCAYDMEAAGYYPVACRFSTGELVQCYKVVSDGPAADARPAPAAVTRLIESRLPEIARLAQSLTAARELLERVGAASGLLDYCLERWHFTATQHHRLARLCKRAQVLELDAACRDRLAALASGAAALQQLEAAVAAAPPRFDGDGAS